MGINYNLCLDWWWSAEIFPVEYGRILKRNGLGKLLKISPRPYRHEYQRFVNAQFPIFSRLRMTRGRLARITNFRWSILNFADSHARLINKMEGRWKWFITSHKISFFFDKKLTQIIYFVFRFYTAETLRLSQSRDIPWYHGISRDITWSRVISRVMDRDITWSRVISRDFAWWTVISRDITFKLFFHFLQKKFHKLFFKYSFNLIILTKTNSLFSYYVFGGLKTQLNIKNKRF